MQETDPLDNRPWLKVVEECVTLFDELERHKAGFAGTAQELADHVNARLQEILERSGVEVIAVAATYDRLRHQPDASGVGIANGSLVSAVVSPGFAVGRRVFRRAQVRLSQAGAE